MEFYERLRIYLENEERWLSLINEIPLSHFENIDYKSCIKKMKMNKPYLFEKEKDNDLGNTPIK